MELRFGEPECRREASLTDQRSAMLNRMSAIPRVPRHPGRPPPAPLPSLPTSDVKPIRKIRAFKLPPDPLVTLTPSSWQNVSHNAGRGAVVDTLA